VSADGQRTRKPTLGREPRVLVDDRLRNAALADQTQSLIGFDPFLCSNHVIQVRDSASVAPIAYLSSVILDVSHGLTVRTVR